MELKVITNENDDLNEIIEELKELNREGKLASLAVTYSTVEKEMWNAYYVKDDNSTVQLLGMVELLKVDILNDMD